MFPLSFHLLRKCRKQCEHSKLNVKMPKIFFFFLSRFNVISKKKGHRADGGIFFSDFMLISKKKKKKVLRLSSASFLGALCDITERGAMNHTCLQFLVGEKMPEFTKFYCKMPENISHFFALIGNTVTYTKTRQCLTDANATLYFWRAKHI